MKGKRFTAEQIIPILLKADSGISVANVSDQPAKIVDANRSG
jgi:hypothetical protein